MENVVEQPKPVVEQVEENKLQDALHRIVLAAVGTVGLVQDEVEHFVNKAVERGQIAEKEARKSVHEVTERRKDDTGPYELLDQLALNLRQLLPPLPPGGARPQTAWSDTAVVTGRAAGIPVTVTSQATSRAGPWDRLDGSLVLRVTRSTAYTLEGEGNPAGSWIVLRGRGVNHTPQVLDSAGGIVHGVQADTLRVEIEVAGTGFVVPVLQTRADTLRRATP